MNARPRFDGDTLEEQDHARLGRQLLAVKRLMADGQWRTLADIAGALEIPEASGSSRLRDLRKAKFGAYVVERRRSETVPGLFCYRLLPPLKDGQLRLL